MSTDAPNPKAEANDDAWGCCLELYPNGLVSVLFAQVFILLGWLLSMAGIFDCKFVVADVYDENNGLPPGNVTTALWGPDDRTGFGFIYYEDSSGECVVADWVEASEENENSTDTGVDVDVDRYIADYIDWLGDDWNTPRILLGTAAFISVLAFIWVLVMICYSRPRFYRILEAIVPIAVLAPLNFASLSVLNSDFCSGRNCELGRSGIAGLCAAIMCFLGGVALCFTRNYSKREEEEAPLEAGLEMVENAEYVIENERAAAQQPPGEIEEVVIGDGLAEAQEIKPDMMLLHGGFDGAEEPVIATSASSFLPTEEVPTVIATSASSFLPTEEVPTVVADSVSSLPPVEAVEEVNYVQVLDSKPPAL
jgi:hypothetical protein